MFEVRDENVERRRRDLASGLKIKTYGADPARQPAFSPCAKPPLTSS